MNHKHQNRDEGSSLILVLVVMIIAAFFVLPTMTYIMTVNQASRMRIQGANSSEVVRGGLRSVLYDPAGLYSECSKSGASAARDLAVPPGMDISTKCTTVGTASQWVPSSLRWALTTTMVGAAAVIPPPYVAPPARPDLDGTISDQWCTSAVTDSLPCGYTYPNNNSTAATYAAWTADATDSSQGNKIFLPYVPSVNDAAGYAGGYNVDIGNGKFCKVYFPGRYTDNVIITGTTPVYFVSGVYYFEKTLRFSGDAQVVVGAGAAEGCIDSDAVAVADAGYADATSNGVGGTFVFGAQGRMIVDTVTPSTLGAATKGVSVVFNRRLVDPSDPDVIMNNVAIMSVNGDTDVVGKVTNDHDAPGIMKVPHSMVYGTTPADPYSQDFMASTLIPTTAPLAGTASPCLYLPAPAVPAATCPIVDINLTTPAAVTVSIPGYVAVPQGAVSINTVLGMSAAKKISFGGGLLTGTIAVSAVKPASLQIGLLNSVVQMTFKVVSQTLHASPRVTATALIQVNQTGGYAINSWVTSYG